MQKEVIIGTVVVVLLVVVIIYQTYTINKSIDRDSRISYDPNVCLRPPCMVPVDVQPNVQPNVEPTLQPNVPVEVKLTPSLQPRNDVSVKYYYSTRCGHCINFMPEWDRFSGKFQNQNIEKVNCFENGDACANITSVPHIIFTKGGVETVYKSSRTADALESFYIGI